MSSKSREELIEETHAAAVSVVEDFDHLKSISEKAETSPVDLRHASAILRRWLVEGVLQRVSNPRTGRLQIMAIDNNRIYRTTRGGGIHNFVSAGAKVHGVCIAAGMMNSGSRPPQIVGYHPDNLIELKLESFQKQRVIYTNGEWLTRHQIVKFVANVDHGVHGGEALEDWENLLAEFRLQVSVQLEAGPDGNPMPVVGWGFGDAGGVSKLEDYDPSRINGVLLELLATISFLISSPTLERLIEVVREEL